MSPIVVDVSIAADWLLGDEFDPRAAFALGHLDSLMGLPILTYRRPTLRWHSIWPESISCPSKTLCTWNWPKDARRSWPPWIGHWPGRLAPKVWNSRPRREFQDNHE